jgi:hypothetical protein
MLTPSLRNWLGSICSDDPATLSIPDPRDIRSRSCIVGGREAVHIFERTQYVVVADVCRVGAADLDVLTDEERGDLVSGT